MEERIGKLEARSFDIIQSEEQNAKVKSLRDLWDRVKKTNTCMKEKEEEKGGKKFI